MTPKAARLLALLRDDPSELLSGEGWHGTVHDDELALEEGAVYAALGGFQTALERSAGVFELLQELQEAGEIGHSMRGASGEIIVRLAPELPPPPFKDWGTELESADPARLLELSASDDQNARVAVAFHGSAPPAALERLKSDPVPRVRWAVAMSRNAPAAVLRALASDSDGTVRKGVAHNHHTPGDVLATLSEDDWAVIETVAANPSTPPSALAALLRGDAHDSIRARIWANPSLPQEYRSEGAGPGPLSAAIVAALAKANARLSRKLPLEALREAVRRASASDGFVCVTQPAIGYAWADCTVVAAMAARLGDQVVARIRRRRSYRGATATPASWPELRGFPRGDVATKLANWARADDAVKISWAAAAAAPRYLGPGADYFEYPPVGPHRRLQEG